MPEPTPCFPIIYVNNSEIVSSLINSTQNVKDIFFDMEVDNMYHYKSRICLIQLLIEETCYLVDPLCDINVHEILDTLKDKNLIIHGSDFDLRMLYQNYGFAPKKIFDTMIAAQLIGKRSFGLAALVKEYFGIDLNKKFQKADWSKRPLSDDMIYYAAQDTFFLPRLNIILSEALESCGRLSWHSEWCENLIDAAQKSKKTNLDQIWRIKGSAKLKPRQLHVLKSIWKWREQTARKLNKAVFKVMNSNAILDIAMKVPPNEEQMIDLKSLSLKVHRSMKAELLSILEQSLADNHSLWPKRSLRNTKRIPFSKPAIVELLKKERDRLAEDLNLPGSVLANKESLLAIAATELNSREEMHNKGNLMAWQENLLFESWINKAAL